mmetsp:Transcript_68805/g.143696  ORF Transcript_68805/g.143696 Transcript_68805/m.143696 type:complete len:253 (-) Transcript_68805:942-1700(-)
MLDVKLTVESLILAIFTAGEVGHHDLPVSLTLGHLLSQPHLLFSPQVGEVLWARLDRSRAIHNGAVGIGRVVLGAAHVVFRVLGRLLGIVEIGIHKIDIDREVLVGILHWHHVVDSRHHPTLASVGVGDLLVPTVVEHSATPVVVAQNTQPWLARQTGSLVDILVDLVELMVSSPGNLTHRSSASLLDTAPVEVITDIEEETRILLCCTFFHRTGDKLLRLRVDTLDEATAGRAALALAHGVEASNELLVRT